MDITGIHYIEPTQAAHNIASAFCAHEIQKLPDDAFEPGALKANPYIRNMWQLYSNVYDSIFEMALADNAPSTDEE